MVALIRFLPFLLLPLSVMSQKTPIKFGDIPIEDLKMTRYEKDSGASAIVLADRGETTFQYDQGHGFFLQFERLRRIKILSKAGLDYANFSIPLYHDGGIDEKLMGFKAITFNLENGKIQETKLNKDAVFDEKQDANIDMKKLTMPNVRVGSVIEITYSVRSEFIFNFQDWEFQNSIPTVWSEYRANIPEYFNYDMYMQGYIQLSSNEQTEGQGVINFVNTERFDNRGYSPGATQNTVRYKEQKYSWVATDVPAFKPEPFITTSRDYISKINFELTRTQFPNQPVKQYMGSWEDINKQYVESSNFGEEVTGNAFLKKTVEEITAGVTANEEKMVVIANFVKQNFTWDEASGRFPSTTLKQVMDSRKGNSADLNLLLASMLDKAGINVKLVLLSTRDHGFVREQTPISSQFNYVICQASINDKAILLDATEKLLAIGVLPQRCLNGNGFMVSKEGYKWVPLQSTIKSKTIINVDLALSVSGELNGKLRIDRTGYDALESRKNYIGNAEEQYMKDLVGSRSWEITKSEIENVKIIDQPLKEAYELVINQHVVSAADALYLNPILLHRIEENPFKLEGRTYPVDFGYAFDKIYMGKISIPEGYQVDELPPSKVLTLPANAGKFTYSIVQSDKQLVIVSNFQINKSIFTQEEYPNLREFYNQVIAKQAEQIVLKKRK